MKDIKDIKYHARIRNEKRFFNNFAINKTLGKNIIKLKKLVFK